MKKAKLSVLLGVTSFMLAVAVMPAFSGPMSSSSYSIPSLTISSGGHTGLQSSSYKLQDIKGQAVIGYGSSASYGLGIGGVYGTLVPGGGPVSALGDIGLIRNTQIFRNTTARGSNLRFTWSYASDSGVSQAEIWRLSGVGINYSTTAIWLRITTTASGITEYVDTTITAPLVGDGKNAYYRVVPKDATDKFATSNNSRTAAKIDVNLSSLTSKIVAIPVYAGPINTVMAGQVGNDEFYFYPRSGTGLDTKKYINDRLEAVPFEVAPGVGFWFENKSGNNHTVTFTGTLETHAPREIARVDITGNTLPYTLQSTGLSAFEGDYIHPPMGTGLTTIVFRDGRWQGTFSLNNSDGCWYRHVGTRYWIIDLKNGVSIRDRL